MNKIENEVSKETYKENIFILKEKSSNPHYKFIQPLPDEFVRGHIGRWGKMFGLNKYLSCINRINRQHRYSKDNLTSPLTIRIISEAIGFSCEKYVQLHTLIPFFNFPSPDKAFDSNGHIVDSILRRRSCALARAHAHFCPICIEEDKQAIGYSYWKRTHQLPGHFWCHKHTEYSLHFIDIKEPFCQPPEYWLNHEKSKTYSLPSDIRDHPKVKLFYSICQAMVDSKTYKRYKTIDAIFNNKSAKMGISNSRNNTCTTTFDRLSDIALKKLPIPFIKILFPRIASKRKREFFPSIDEAIAPSKNIPLPTATAIAITIFYESLEEALNEFNSEQTTITIKKQNQQSIKNTKFIL